MELFCIAQYITGSTVRSTTSVVRATLYQYKKGITRVQVKNASYLITPTDNRKETVKILFTDLNHIKSCFEHILFINTNMFYKNEKHISDLITFT